MDLGVNRMSIYNAIISYPILIYYQNSVPPSVLEENLINWFTSYDLNNLHYFQESPSPLPRIHSISSFRTNHDYVCHS